MRTEGEISKELFKEKTEEAEIRMNEIKTKLFALQPSEDTPTTEDYSKKLELLNLLLERLTDFSIPSEIPDQVVEAFIKKIVVYQDHTDWYLRIKDKQSGFTRNSDFLSFGGSNRSISLENVKTKKQC